MFYIFSTPSKIIFGIRSLPNRISILAEVLKLGSDSFRWKRLAMLAI